MVQAEKILELYKRMQIEAEVEYGDDQEGLLENEREMKERLFVETGEDVEDIFIAFKHYGMNHHITEDDRKKYQINVLVTDTSKE
jgi:hypothetical protein